MTDPGRPPPNHRTWHAWYTVHQPFELNWWREHPQNLESPGFEAHWAEVIDFIKPTGHVLDVGCGPRTPFAPCTVIDPLAVDYQKFTPPEWWEGVTVHAHRAEHRVIGLKADTIVCWNCLDHTIGWRDILDNLRHYASPGATINIATDFYPPFEGHPGFERELFEAEIEKRFVTLESREPFGRQLALRMRTR